MTEKDVVNVINKKYDMDTYQNLMQKPLEKLSQREKDYCVFCYHMEEAEAGLL